MSAPGPLATAWTPRSETSFSPAPQVFISAGHPVDGAVATPEVGDEVLDVVTANFYGDSVSVLLGSGTGELDAPIVIPVAGGPRFVVAWDFDGDDKADGLLVVVSPLDKEGISVKVPGNLIHQA